MSGSPVTSGREACSRTGSELGRLAGERAHRQVAVGDHRQRVALRIAEDHRADGVVAHQPGDLEHLGVEAPP